MVRKSKEDRNKTPILNFVSQRESQSGSDLEDIVSWLFMNGLHNEALQESSLMYLNLKTVWRRAAIRDLFSALQRGSASLMRRRQGSDDIHNFLPRIVFSDEEKALDRFWECRDYFLEPLNFSVDGDEEDISFRSELQKQSREKRSIITSEKQLAELEALATMYNVDLSVARDFARLEQELVHEADIMIEYESYPSWKGTTADDEKERASGSEVHQQEQVKASDSRWKKFWRRLRHAGLGRVGGASHDSKRRRTKKHTAVARNPSGEGAARGNFGSLEGEVTQEKDQEQEKQQEVEEPLDFGWKKAFVGKPKYDEPWLFDGRNIVNARASPVSAFTCPVSNLRLRVYEKAFFSANHTSLRALKEENKMIRLKSVHVAAVLEDGTTVALTLREAASLDLCLQKRLLNQLNPNLKLDLISVASGASLRKSFDSRAIDATAEKARVILKLFGGDVVMTDDEVNALRSSSVTKLSFQEVRDFFVAILQGRRADVSLQEKLTELLKGS